MIYKIHSLISIGKFSNYQAAGDVAFKKTTLIYADNGSGKTTVSSVFRSLAENDPRRIIKRKTINATVAQTATIIHRPEGTTNDVTHRFTANAWSSSYPNIEVFDTHFVDENIYSGCQFSEEHKKQLHQFVIGAQSVTIQQQLYQNKIDKTNSRNAQIKIENQIISGVGNGLALGMMTQYLRLSANMAENIDARIAEATNALTHANANAVIQTLPSLSNQVGLKIALNWNDLKDDLQMSTQSLQDASLQILFDNHCNDLVAHGMAESKIWLNAGFKYYTNHEIQSGPVNCPFCQQPLEGPSAILNAYTEVFNTSFNDYVQRLNGYIVVLSAVNLDVHIQRISAATTANNERIASWKTHLPAEKIQPLPTIISDENAIRSTLEEVLRKLRDKTANPTQATTTEKVAELISLITEANEAVEVYNLQVTAYNTSITNFRSSIQTVADTQTRLNELVRIKKRFEPTIASLCSELQTERKNLKKLEAAYTSLSDQQQAAAHLFFSTYKDRINHYLQMVFKTPFRISDVVHVAPQGRATQNKINYKLTLNGHDIPFDVAQENSVKDCLSEGDKSTIALAFFLSKLDIDPEKSGKILIFDDPLSSFDSHRRMYTVQLIKNLISQIKQVVILSHNEHFLYEIFKITPPSDRKTLRIFQNYVTGHSTIEEFDLQKLVQNDYFKHLRELEDFLNHPDLLKKDIVLGWLRNVLEAHIRFKFHRQLVGISGNNQTLGSIINKLDTGGVAFRDSNRQAVLDLLRLINNISCKSHHGEPLPDYAALGTDPATINVTELCHFITDTIDLIDKRL